MMEMLFPVTTRMCAHGLRDPEWDQPPRKDTRLVVSSGAVSEALALPCPGDHSHRHIQGTWCDRDRRVDAAAWCGGCTHEFSTNALKVFEKQLKLEIYVFCGGWHAE